MGNLSAHFDTTEFACKHCGRTRVVDPELVVILEAIRSAIKRPLPIVSGYRCPTHNTAVGGARASQHLLGRAADLPPRMVTLAQAVAAGARGIGIRGGWVVHVDSRRVAAPVMWYYD